MKKVLWMMFFVLIFFQNCFAFNAKPNPTTSFFFGSPFFLFGYFGSEDIQISLFSESKVGYSIKGGFIDSTHMGDSFNWVIYYQKEIYEQITKKDNQKEKKIVFEMSVPSKFFVLISYPVFWDDLNEQEKNQNAKEISINLAHYLAYNLAVYHEMLTWYGYKSTGMFSEFGSAFSPEDLYSDCLGSIIAVKALRAKTEFNRASINILKEELCELEIQKKSVVKKAHKAVIGDWWNGENYPNNNVYKRNFDIGEDGFISPCLVDKISKDSISLISLPVPQLPVEKGFSIKVEIECREKESKNLLAIVNEGVANKKEFIEPAVDFTRIMEVIKKESVEKLKH